MADMQENTEIEESADPRKYEIGRILTFRSYGPDEVLPRNGCGMGISVERITDGVKDMIWPTEVCVTRIS